MPIKELCPIFGLNRQHSTIGHLEVAIGHLFARSVSGHARFYGMIGYRPRPVRKQFGTGGAVFVGLLDMGVGGGAALDIVDKPGGGEPAAAPFAALQGMFADRLIPDGHRADVLAIFHPDRAGGTDIGAGTAADATVRFGNHKTDPANFVHL